MSRPIGHPKTGGRKKGTPNKRTSQLRDILDMFQYDPAKAILEKYPYVLDIKEQILIDLKMMEYVYPRATWVNSNSELAQSEESNPCPDLSLLSEDEKKEFAENICEEIFLSSDAEFCLKLIKAKFPNLIIQFAKK